MGLFVLVLAHIQIASPGLRVLRDIYGDGRHHVQATGLVGKQCRQFAQFVVVSRLFLSAGQRAMALSALSFINDAKTRGIQRMICYPEDATEEEISVINDYWLLSDESLTGFLYTVEKINNYYKPKKTRSAIGLVRKSRFFLPRPAFCCQDCSRKIPVGSRKEYADRIKSEVPTICSACSELKRQRVIDDAYRTLNDYKAKKFEPIICLDSLTIEETLVLLSISSENSGNDNYLGESPAEIPVTGAQLVDDNLLHALIDKRALIYIWEIPLGVERANTVIYGDVSRIKYDTKFKNTRRYRHAHSVTCGLYLNNKTSAGYVEVSELSSFLHQKLYSATWSINDVANVHQIIKEVQIDKLYKLVMEISGEYKLPIGNSNVLRALLNHLADNYPPQNLYFTFRVKARDVIIYMHKDKDAAHGHRAKNYFAKFVGNYIAYIENRGFDLKKTWTLPESVQTSTFEALFSRLYLNGHFNWDRLSAKEVIALWLENVCLSESAQESLTKDDEENSMQK